MDPLQKKILQELEQMQTGRLLRNMSVCRMLPTESQQWQPSVDIYESEETFIVYADIAGAAKEDLAVTITGQELTLKGKRRLPAMRSIACVHQLEIELGTFERTIVLPAPVNPEAVKSVYSDGILKITLPRQNKPGKVHISIHSGE